MAKQPKTIAPELEKKRKRLSPEDRRRHIVEEALRHFAEHGFEANTRILAQRIGVTQPLLFRYFSTKEDLIEAVFDLAYVRLAKRDWSSLVRQTKGDFRSRLINFFFAYARENYDFDWIRLYMFAGLAGGELNRRYIKRVTEPVLRAVALEVRTHLGLPRSEKSVSQAEMEYLWIFHGGLFYYSIRHHIYGMPTNAKAHAALVATAVDTMIMGYRDAIKPKNNAVASLELPAVPLMN